MLFYRSVRAKGHKISGKRPFMSKKKRKFAPHNAARVIRWRPERSDDSLGITGGGCIKNGTND